MAVVVSGWQDRRCFFSISWIYLAHVLAVKLTGKPFVSFCPREAYKMFSLISLASPTPHPYSHRRRNWSVFSGLVFLEPTRCDASSLQCYEAAKACENLVTVANGMKLPPRSSEICLLTLGAFPTQSC